MQEVHLLRRLHRDVLFLGFSDGVVPCDWLCGFLVLSSLFLVSVSCFFVCLGAGFHVGFYFAYVSVVPLFVRGRLPHGGRAWRPRRVPAPAERGDVHGREPARRLSGMRHRCISSSRCFVFSHVFFSGLGSCMHFPYFSGCAEVFLPNMRASLTRRLWPVDRDAIVRPGPWTRGGPRGRPRMGFRVDHVFGWSAEWTVVRQGGPRCRPSHGLSRGPHDWSGMWTIGPFA